MRSYSFMDHVVEAIVWAIGGAFTAFGGALVVAVVGACVQLALGS